jgi:hypothetical protein
MSAKASKLIWEWKNPSAFIDHCRVYLHFPSIQLIRGEHTISGQSCFWIGLLAPTEISFDSEEDVGWSVIFCVLGFGISVHRQWGY